MADPTGSPIISDLVGPVVRPTAERVGETLGLVVGVILDPINERLKAAAQRRTERVLAEAVELISARNADPARLIDAAPEVLTAALLANASSVDAPELQRLFAGLLASAAVGDATSAPPWIADTLRQLDGPSARLLALLNKHGFIAADGLRSSVSVIRPSGREVRHESPRGLTGPAVEGRDDVTELSASAPLLKRLALVEEETGRWGERESVEGGGYREINVRDRAELRLSDFGSQLCAVCLGLYAATAV